MLELIWFAGLVWEINLLYTIIKYRKIYEKKVDYSRKFHSPKLLFVLVAKNCPSFVQKGIDSVNSACKTIEYFKYEMIVIADSFESKPKDAKLIRVPHNFSCKSKYKARALQYFLMQLPYNENTWILHMDEESVVTEQCVRSILEYIEDNGKPIAEGPNNYPNEIHGLIPFLIESERAVDDYVLIQQLKNGVPIWLHGSNLLIRADLEHKISWDFQDCLCEDSRFGYDVIRNYKNLFGWHGGIMLEQPSFSIKDCFKQRRRWFYGSFQNLKFIPSKKLRFAQIGCLTSWTLGFFSSLVSILSLMGLIQIDNALKIPFLVITGIWFLQYQIGLHLNLRHLKISRLKKIGYHFAQVILSPVLGVLATIPTIYALIKPPKKFDIVQK